MIARIKKLLPTNRFARGVSVLLSGTAGAQLIAVLATPFLTRLYTPQEFGVLAVYVSVIALFSVVASAKYEVAIPLPRKHSEAVTLTILAVSVVLLVSLLLAVVAWFVGPELVTWLGVSELSGVTWLIPVGVLLVGLFQVASYRAVRASSFGVLAQARVSQQLAIAVVQLAAFKLSSLGLLLGHTLGQAIGVTPIYRKLLKNDLWHARSVHHLWRAAHRYRHFPFYSSWAGLLNAAGTHIPPILFAALFSASSAGIYALAHRIVAMPMNLLGQAVSQVFLSNAAIDYREGRLTPLVISAQRALIQVIAIPSIFLALFASHLFPLIFGEQWILAGEVAAWLALWMLVAFSTSPLSSIFSIVERQRLGLLMQGVLFSCRVIGIAIGVYYDSFMAAVIWFSIFNVLGYLIYQVVAFRTIGLSIATSLKGYWLPLLALAIVYLLRGHIPEVGLFAIFILGSVASIFYYALLAKRLKK
ncbi:oligosaccharide flippase family protein [Idiomarina sp.]|uniref:oligosaccharide flippase family protein n=1 Tax=Idiomarina sp. TaxID=1874361 RepID=UPI001DC55499|nr:oligosaccharide flippase family protein [Idiomarina sp.]MCJ8316221.1 oligosaccharide flippase family protein [Idiomarina sp.]NQZ16134.1 oligosaccharide flippase family protein [Idiomarina sp.]